MTEFKPGDTITLVKDNDRLVREVKRDEDDGALYVDGLTDVHDGAVVQHLVDAGWRIADVKPKPEPLPSEPHTAWVDKYGTDIWTVNGFGVLRSASSPGSDPAKYAPFTRLRPEADVRREVWQEVRTSGVTGDVWAYMPDCENHCDDVARSLLVKFIESRIEGLA